MQSIFKMPVPVKIIGRTSSITNAFVNGIIPCIMPTEAELQEVLTILGMKEVVACAYCGDAFTEWDHFRPLIKNKRPTGYISEIHNLVPACGKCNQSKGNSSWRKWIVGDANLSPKSRNVANLDERIERLEKFEVWSTPTKVDFESVVGKEMWAKHWENCEKLHEMMKESQLLSDEIKRIVYEDVHNVKETKVEVTQRDNGVKVGQIVKSVLKPLLESNQISSDEIKLLQTVQYSKEQFGVYYPILKELDLLIGIDEQRRDSKGYPRYYKDSITINDKKYLLCSEWSAKSKQPLLNWIAVNI